MKVNIRCCCAPDLLLGVVDVEFGLLRLGDQVRFPLADGSTLALQVGDAYDRSYVVDPAAPSPCELVLTSRRELALKSNDTPLERLRLISGFIEINTRVPIGRCPLAR
jgi:hypothetical protein